MERDTLETQILTDGLRVIRFTVAGLATYRAYGQNHLYEVMTQEAL